MRKTKEDYIKYRISKSDEVFEDARILASSQRWNSCVNRLYYSAFYLVSALLYKMDIKADTHNGIKTQFFQHFVKTNHINKDFAKLYSHLFDWRQESDYADFIEFDQKTTEPLIEKVYELNCTIKELIKAE
ncbi:MAG: HEPN domain-containing protein [Bacteroidia bacterium]